MSYLHDFTSKSVNIKSHCHVAILNCTRIAHSFRGIVTESSHRDHQRVIWFSCYSRSRIRERSRSKFARSNPRHNALFVAIGWCVHATHWRSPGIWIGSGGLYTPRMVYVCSSTFLAIGIITQNGRWANGKQGYLVATSIWRITQRERANPSRWMQSAAVPSLGLGFVAWPPAATGLLVFR